MNPGIISIPRGFSLPIVNSIYSIFTGWRDIFIPNPEEALTGDATPILKNNYKILEKNTADRKIIPYVYDLYEEARLSPKQYVLTLIRRELNELKLVYEIDNRHLEEAGMPVLNNQMTQAQQENSVKRWLSEQPHYSVDVMVQQLKKVFATSLKRDALYPTAYSRLDRTFGNRRTDFSEPVAAWEPYEPPKKSLVGRVLLKNIKPYKEVKLVTQNGSSGLPTIFSPEQSLEFAFRENQWTDNFPYVAVKGIYTDIVAAYPRHAIASLQEGK